MGGLDSVLDERSRCAGAATSPLSRQLPRDQRAHIRRAQRHPRRLVLLSRRESDVAGPRRPRRLPLALLLGHASNTLHDDVLSTQVRRRWPNRGAETEITVRVGEQISEQSEFEVFVTARWGLYSRSYGRGLMYAPVDHPRWSLYRAEIIGLNDTLVRAAGLPESIGPPHCMFSPGVPVRIGMPKRVRW